MYLFFILTKMLLHTNISELFKHSTGKNIIYTAVQRKSRIPAAVWILSETTQVSQY